MQFRCPEILEPDRTRSAARTEGSDTGERLRQSEQSLRAAREYGRVLWDQLNEVHDYLLDAVAGGETGQRPPLLADAWQWHEWADLYGRTSRALAGRSGDSGYGWSTAVLVARVHGIDVDADADADADVTLAPNDT